MAALKPCGTPAAYRRHLRNGEAACDACKAAVRRGVGDRNAEKRRSAGEARLKLVEPPVDVNPDPLEVARDNLSIASLTRRREELVEKIIDLSAADEVEVTVDDAGDAGWSLEAL